MRRRSKRAASLFPRWRPASACGRGEARRRQRLAGACLTLRGDLYLRRVFVEVYEAIDVGVGTCSFTAVWMRSRTRFATGIGAALATPSSLAKRTSLCISPSVKLVLRSPDELWQGDLCRIAA